MPIIAAAIIAGSSIYAAQQAKKGAKGPGMAGNIDPSLAQYQAIQGNLSNQADIEKLVSSTNKFDQDQAISLMEQAMPGYKGLSSKLTTLAGNLASNPYEVPKDVQDNLHRLAAEKGIATGRQGQAGQFSLLRDLGLNELQYGAQNINQAQGLTSLLASIAPRINPMSPMSMYITPNQQIGAAENNQAMNQGYLNANAEAANQRAAIDANMWSKLGTTIAGAYSSYTSPSTTGMGSQTGAASGQNGIQKVQTDWSFPQNKNGMDMNKVTQFSE